MEPLLALASLLALLFNAPLLLSLSAGEQWGQKVPLRVQHNKTKAALRSICQPSPPPPQPRVDIWKVFSGFRLAALRGWKSTSGGDTVHSRFIYIY